MYVIDGLDNMSWLPDGAFAVLVKVHHVALDDVTEDDFTIALHDLEAVPEATEAQRRWFSEKEPGAVQLLALAWFNNTIKLIETGTDEVVAVYCEPDREGKPVKENAGLGSLEVVWHSDNSYIDEPPPRSTRPGSRASIGSEVHSSTLPSISNRPQRPGS